MGEPRMSGVEAGTWNTGTYLDGRYREPSRTSTCRRCGVDRQVRAGNRPVNDICVDCKTVERITRNLKPEPVTGYRPIRGKAGIVRFKPVTEPMSPEDLAWAEKAAEDARRLQTERANRAGWYTRKKAA